MDNISKIAETLAKENNLEAYKFDLFYRDYDDKIELLGYVDDPTYSRKDFEGREMLFPKKWVTLKVYPSEVEV